MSLFLFAMSKVPNLSILINNNMINARYNHKEKLFGILSSFSSFYIYLLFTYLFCMCMCVDTHVPQDACRGQK